MDPVEHMSGPYTIQHVEFMDGDTRTKYIHNYGWSATNYLQEILWVDSEKMWLEYYEDDVRRWREVYSVEDYPGYGDWIR